MGGMRMLFGLLWIAWGLGWVIGGQEILGWPYWWAMGALLTFALIYNLVPNWWAPISGIWTFVLFWVGGGTVVWLWSFISPDFNYTANFGEWVTFSLLCSYIGVFIFKAGSTLHAMFNPDDFNRDYLEALRKNQQRLPLEKRSGYDGLS